MSTPSLDLGVELKGRRALVACQSFSGFSGSEIVTLELAEALSLAGASVTITAANVGGPIDSWLARAGIPVTAIDGLTSGSYDLLWVHHWPVWARLAELQIEARRIVYSCLSPFEPRELPPLTGRALHLYAANSEETRARLVDDFGLPTERVVLFLNSAPQPFFGLSLPNRRGTIERLAIVSNHVPAEIKELADLLRGDGVVVEVIGDGARYERVTTDLLVGFDAVITIGRTVQYCLAAAVPVFVYDRFGGPGWLTEANWQLAERFNFSGRCTRRPRSAVTLRTELVTGHPSALALTEHWRRLAAGRFAFEPNLAATLRCAFAQPRALKPSPTVGLVRAYSEAYAQLQAELTEQHLAARTREADRLLAWKRVSELQTALDARSEQLKHIETQLQKLGAVDEQLASLRSQIQHLQDDVTSRETERERLSHAVEELGRERVAAEQRYADEILQWRQQAEHARAALQRHHDDRASERQQVDRALAALERQIVALEGSRLADIRRAEEEAFRLRQELAKTEEQVLDGKALLAGAMGTVEALNAAIQARDHRAGELTEELHSLKASFEVSEQAHLKATEALRAETTLRKDLEASLEQAADDSAITVATLKAQLNELEQRKAAVDQTLASVIESSSKREQEHQRIEQEWKAMMQKAAEGVAVVSRQIAELHAEMGQGEGAEVLPTQIANAMSPQGLLLAECDMLAQATDRLRQDAPLVNGQVMAALGELRSALERRDIEVAALRQQVADLQMQRSASAAEVAVLVDSKGRLADEKLQVQGRVEELSASLERLANELRAARLRVDEAERAARADCYRAQAAETRLGAVFNSRSWRLTAPVRLLGTGARNARSMVRRAVLRSSQAVWRLLPLGREAKDALKAGVFPLLAPLISGTGVYRRWTEYERARAELAALAKAQPLALPKMGELKPATPLTPAAERLPVLPEPVAVPLTMQAPLADTSVTLIAFYLPQFHPIPENDAWWGPGFTEWTNVTRARSQFVGHYQPHVPGELGYYDLRVPEVQRRQVELAKLYGVGAFCFYFYWFAGHRLLERPVLQYLNDPSLDLPFCLCWANENWSRRWDGLDQDLLISQKHSPEDDIAFIEYLGKYLRDRRYVRVAGRPLVLVYRPCLLPDARATAARWRDWCRANGIGEIFLAYTQSFSAVDPGEYGFDAAIEFPPNNSGPPDVTDRIEKTNPDFRGVVYDWRVFVERSRRYSTPTYRLYRGVTPSWDNEARKIGRGAVLYGSTPEGFREWLGNAAVDTVKRFSQRDERLVFVNAWNEWAEGAHLEPDRRYGYAWLQAVRDALCEVQQRVVESLPPQPPALSPTNADIEPQPPADVLPAETVASSATTGAADNARRVVIVTHDAHPHGAQFLALHLAEGFERWLEAQIDIVVLGDGPLKSDFTRFGRVHDMAGVDPEGPQAHALADKLRAAGATSALCNTAVSGKFLGTLKRAGFHCVSLIHEMPGILSKYGLRHHAEIIARDADCVVFPALTVADGFSRFGTVDSGRVRIRPQGLYKRNRFAGGGRQEARRVLREQLGLPETARIVLGVGYADHRKGIDLFVASGDQVMAARQDTYFIWVGHHDLALWPEIQGQIDVSPFRSRFILPGRLSDTDAFYAGADVYALTSREDPFPSVVLESLEVSVPVVGFEGTGGCCELIRDSSGLLVDAFDVAAYADAICRVLGDPGMAERLGRRGEERVRDDFSFRRYLFDLAAWLHMGVQRVSVVVPNYNYARYLAERLATITAQTYPIYELLVLDDASTDNSVQVASNELAGCSIDYRLVANQTNSGSVFRQWRRGVDLAGGDLVWIAEADDLADPDFLELTVPAFNSPSVVLSYCQSRQMATDGTTLCEHYLDYTADISREKWCKAYVENGVHEIREAMSVKNTIPNVSAVVFRRAVLAQALDESAEQLATLRVAGDWLVYVAVLARGDVAFTPRTMNSHRRHQGSVTVSNFNVLQLEEILQMQAEIRAKFEVAPEVSDRAAAYAQTLFMQFGLADDAIKRIHDHPSLVKYLTHQVA
jgi:O-antigen biosynthesis protein